MFCGEDEDWFLECARHPSFAVPFNLYTPFGLPCPRLQRACWSPVVTLINDETLPVLHAQPMSSHKLFDPSQFSCADPQPPQLFDSVTLSNDRGESSKVSLDDVPAPETTPVPVHKPTPYHLCMHIYVFIHFLTHVSTFICNCSCIPGTSLHHKRAKTS